MSDIDIDKLENIECLRHLPPSKDLFECQGCGRFDTRCTCSETLADAVPALIAEVRRLRSEKETLRKIVADCIEQGTDGHAHPACTLEFLSCAPREVAATKRQRDEARDEYDELLRRTEKREEAERIVNAGSLPSHLERAEDRELDRLRAIEAAAREYYDTTRFGTFLASHDAWIQLEAALAAKGTP